MIDAPFPYFGGKRRAAPIVWRELGDVGGYIEPFAGSAAVLLGRPKFSGRRVETINDADGWLVNMWRAIQFAPDEVAQHCAWPISEIDLHARAAWLHERRTPELVSWLEGDPEHYDAKAAGWWLYVMATVLGRPSDSGPWVVRDGHLVQGAPGQGVARTLPHLGDQGRGIHRIHLGEERAIARYLSTLTERLRRVRITCGDWARILAPMPLRATAGNPHVGILLDPPYSNTTDVYHVSSDTISAEVRQWCSTAPDDLRIVLCGYEDEHDALLDLGWSKIEGKSGGSGNGFSRQPHAGRRERLWCSPSCLGIHRQDSLFEVSA